MSPVPSLSDVRQPSRVLTFDILRGLAIMGILIVHFANDFSGTWLLTPEQRAVMPFAGENTLVDHVINLLIIDKARTIFSFMFGVSFYLQLNSARRRGIAFRPLFLRRLAVLLIIGIVHAYLLFGGDILRYYVIGGLFLLLTYHWSSRRLVGVGLFLTIIMPLLSGIILRVAHIDSGHLETSATMTGGAIDSYWGYLQRNYQWAVWSFTPAMLQTYCIPVLGNFLFGVWIARAQYLQKPNEYRRPLSRLFKLGLGVSVTSKAVLFILDALLRHHVIESSLVQGWVHVLCWSISYEALSLCYICGVALLCRSALWQRRLAVLAPAGRMTLTNYVGQSIAGILVFGGLGLFGKVGSAECLLIALVFCSVQLLASRWWLQRFRMGPLEWAWRSLAAWKRLPLRLGRPIAALA